MSQSTVSMRFGKLQASFIGHSSGKQQARHLGKTGKKINGLVGATSSRSQSAYLMVFYIALGMQAACVFTWVTCHQWLLNLQRRSKLLLC